MYGANFINQVNTLVIGTRVHQHFLSYNPRVLQRGLVKSQCSGIFPEEIQEAAVEIRTCLNRADCGGFEREEPFGRIRNQRVKNQSSLAFQQITAIKTKMKKEIRHNLAVIIANTVSIHQ